MPACGSHNIFLPKLAKSIIAPAAAWGIPGHRPKAAIQAEWGGEWHDAYPPTVEGPSVGVLGIRPIEGATQF